jgi:hypothetical protein
MKNTHQSIKPVLPDWVLLHVAHYSALIPGAFRDQFLLNDAELIEEV